MKRLLAEEEDILSEKREPKKRKPDEGFEMDKKGSSSKTESVVKV
jgi:hypothetical protein